MTIVVAVRVEAGEPGRARLLLGDALDVLLAEVPRDRRVVREPRDQFAVVELPLRAEVAAVEQAVVLGLLRHHVKRDAQPCHVREDDLPLVQLRHVEAVAHARARPRPDVPPVAVHVQRQEVDGVDALRCQVVEPADEALAPFTLPRRIPVAPIGDVRPVAVQSRVQRRKGNQPDRWRWRMGRAGVAERPVEVGVAEQRLGTADASLEEGATVPCEPQVALADVSQCPAGAEVGRERVRRPDAELACGTVE